jgi:hypothetical protein
MRHLDWIRLLIQVLPFNSRWSVRLRRHLEHCRRCQAGLAGLEEAWTATVSQEKIKKETDFWPDFLDRLERAKPLEHSGQGRRLRWTLAAAGLVVAAAAVGLFIFQQPGEKDDPVSAIKLRVSYITMYEKPAQAFIFKTQDENWTFVWVEKQNSGEVL